LPPRNPEELCWKQALPLDSRPLHLPPGTMTEIVFSRGPLIPPPPLDSYFKQRFSPGFLAKCPCFSSHCPGLHVATLQFRDFSSLPKGARNHLLFCATPFPPHLNPLAFLIGTEREILEENKRYVIPVSQILLAFFFRYRLFDERHDPFFKSLFPIPLFDYPPSPPRPTIPDLVGSPPTSARTIFRTSYRPCAYLFSYGRSLSPPPASSPPT